MDGNMNEEKIWSEIHGSLNHQIIDHQINLMKKHRSILEHRLQETGVFRGQHHLLMCIARNPNLTQKELAAHQNVSTAAVAVSLKKLEKGGYVSRMIDEKDNRSNKIQITEKGLSVVRQSIHIFQEMEEEILTGFTEDEKKQFLSFLIRSGENIKRESEDRINEAL